MLQPHSLLWHYLWVGPDVVLAVLAVLTWRQRLYKFSPAFFVYLIYESVHGFTLWVLDILPTVSGYAYWYVYIAGAAIEGLIKALSFGSYSIILSRVRRPPNWEISS